MSTTVSTGRVLFLFVGPDAYQRRTDNTHLLGLVITANQDDRRHMVVRLPAESDCDNNTTPQHAAHHATCRTSRRVGREQGLGKPDRPGPPSCNPHFECRRHTPEHVAVVNPGRRTSRESRQPTHMRRALEHLNTGAVMDDPLISAHRTRSNRRPVVEPAVVAEIEAVLADVEDTQPGG